jgi:PAS domain-containing protein
MDSGQAAEQIRKELEELRQRVAELEASEEPHMRDGEISEDGEYFRKLAENAYDAILVLNRDGVMRYVSPSVKRITGFEPGEMLGKNAFDLIHPDDRTGIMQTLAAG